MTTPKRAPHWQATLLLLATLVGLTATPAHADTQTRASAFEYDPVSGLLTKEIIEPDDPNLCLVTTYTYDSYGNKTGATTRNCNGSTSEAGAPTAGSDAIIETRTTTTVFDTQGRFPISATNALGQTETRTWNGNYGTVASLTGPNGLSTSWTYDSFGRKLSETRADGTATNTSYALCGTGITCPTAANGVVPKYAITVSQTGSATAISYYDQYHRVIITQTEDKDGTTLYAQTQYDKLGRATKSSRPYKANATIVWTTVAYDLLGRATSTTALDSNGATATSTITYNGLTTIATNAKSQARTEVRNSQGQIKTVTDAYSKTLTYSYDAYGNLTKTVDAAGNTTTVTYDKRGRKTAMSDPDQGNWTYAYDALGQLKRQTDAKAQVVSFQYDKLGRMTQRNEPDLVSTWTYDTCDASLNPAGKCIGKPVKETADNGYVRTMLYDSLGRPTAELDNVDTGYGVAKTYDSNGRVANLVYPTGFGITNVYSANGYLTQVKNTATATIYWQAGATDAEGRINNDTYANGITNTRTYDPNTGRLVQTQSGTTAAPGSVSNQSYVYDTLGNLTQRYDAVTGLNEGFGYDNLNRLTSTSAQVGSGVLTQVSVTYDAIGNILTKSDVGTYTYGTTNPATGTLIQPHAVTKIMMNDGVTQYAAYAYDANGNQTSGAGRTLTWTSWNMPNSITGTTQGKSTPDGTTVSSFQVVYNVAHERVKETLPDGTQVYNISPRVDTGIHVEKRVKPDGTITYVHSLYAGSFPFGTVSTTTPPGGTATTRTRYFHVDHLGSIVAITDETGNVVDRRSYDAWGKRRNTNGTPYANAFVTPEERHGFTGHEELNELGLIHMNGRLYDPATGRFLSADPTIQYPDDMQNYNRYSYINNNPLSAIDASGYGFFKSLFKGIKNIVKGVTNVVKAALKNPVIRTAVAMYVGYQVGGLFGDMYIMSSTTPSLMAASIINGVTGGFTTGLITSGGDLRTAFNGAFSGGLASLTTGLGSDLPWYAQAAAKGVTAGISAQMSGGSFGKAFRYALISAIGKYSLDSYVSLRTNENYASSFETASGPAVYKPPFELVKDSLEQGGESIAQAIKSACKDALGSLCADFTNAQTGSGTLTNDANLWGKPAYTPGLNTFESGPFMLFLAQNIPGVQAFSITHDLAMGQLQVAMNNNMLFKILNPLTIPLFAYAQYGSLGVNSMGYQLRLLRNKH